MEYNIEVSVEVVFNDYWNNYQVYLHYFNPINDKETCFHIYRNLYEDNYDYLKRVEKLLKNNRKVAKMVKKDIINKHSEEMEEKELIDLINRLNETKINVTLEIKK